MSGIARSLYNVAANVPREKRKYVTLGALGGTWLLAYAITASRITDSKLRDEVAKAVHSLFPRTSSAVGASAACLCDVV
jgi:ABC-type branched-subunit amino acid transport system substrate-binding protein